MWSGFGESCRGCNSRVAGIVFDRVTRKTSCSECGFDFGISIVTTEPKNSSSDAFLSTTLGNSQHGAGGSDPLAVASASTKRKFDDLLSSAQGNSQNLGSDDVSIAAMSDMLGLVATIKDRANAIYKLVENTSREKDPNAFVAASIYIACRLEDMTRTTKEISSVANGVTGSQISHAIGLIAEKLNIRKDWFMDIKAANFINRFCSTLQMDGQAVKAAQEAAQSSKCVNRDCSPKSVAAVIVYVIAQLSPEKKLLDDVLGATGVVRTTMTRTYEALYPQLPTIIPKWFAKEKDVKAVVRP